MTKIQEMLFQNQDLKYKEFHAKLMPTGGVDVSNVDQWIKAGAAAVSNKEYAQFHDVLLDAEKALELLSIFDMQDLAVLIAPRKLILVNGKNL